MIQKILEVDRDVDVVSLLTRASTARTLWTWPSSYSRTATTGPRDDCAATGTAWPTGRTCTGCGGVAPVDASKREGAADAKINDKGSRCLAEVSRYDRLARQRRQIEVPETRTPDIRS